MPLSTPAGTFTSSSTCSKVVPSPPHSSQRSVTTVPAPAQRGQAVWTRKNP